MVALPLLSLIAACSSDGGSDSVGSVGDAYAVVIRWFVDEAATDEPPVVFVEPRGEGVAIEIGTQAAVVSASEEFADVRFVDDRSEALTDDGVRDGGLFLALGPVDDDGTSATIESDMIESASSEVGWVFHLSYRNETWRLTEPPTPQP